MYKIEFGFLTNHAVFASKKNASKFFGKKALCMCDPIRKEMICEKIMLHFTPLFSTKNFEDFSSKQSKLLLKKSTNKKIKQPKTSQNHNTHVLHFNSLQQFRSQIFNI